MGKIKYGGVITQRNILEMWANKFPSVMRWLGKLQRKRARAYFLWLYCRWAGLDPEQLLALKEDPRNVEAEELLDKFRSLDGTKDAPYTNSMMWSSVVATRSFYRKNYRALQPAAGKMDLIKMKPYNKPKEKELRALYNAARNPRDRCLVTFVNCSGIARDTLTHITWGHIEEGTWDDPEKSWEDIEIPHIGIEDKLLKGHGRGKWKGVEQHTFLTPEAKRDLINYRDWWQRISGIKLTQEMKIFWTVYQPWRALSYRQLGNISQQLSQDAGVPFSWHDARRVVQTALEELKIHPNWMRKIRGRKVRGEENPYSRPEIEKLREAYREAVPLLEFTSKASKETHKLRQEIEERNKELETVVTKLTTTNLQLNSRISKAEMEIVRILRKVEELEKLINT